MSAVRPLFLCAMHDPKRRGSILWRAWWHVGDKTGVKSRIWVWICWLRGGHDDDSYGSCVICHANLKTARLPVIQVRIRYRQVHG